MAKENSLKRKDTTQEGNLEHQEGKNNMVRKIQVNTINFFLSLEFSKCLIVRSKLIIQFEVIPNIRR